MIDFWVTLFTPRIPGNPWALAILIVGAVAVARSAYKKQHYRSALFLSACVGANLVRLMETLNILMKGGHQ